MNGYFNKVIDILKGQGTAEPKTTVGGKPEKPITPQEFEDQIFTHYEARFDEESTYNKKTKTGSMAFPVSFCIYLHPTDYKNLEQGFRFRVKNIVNAFCTYNREQAARYPPHAPHSQYWTIQFVSFAKDSIVEKAGRSYEMVEVGAPLIVSDLFSRKFTKDNIAQGSNVRATKRDKNLFSLQNVNLAINEEAFKNIENPSDKDTFIVRINRDYSELTDIPKSEDRMEAFEDQALAKLICDKEFIGLSGKNGRECLMVSHFIHISGKNDSRTGVQYAKIDYSLPNDIVQIKYENNDFLLAAFGKVRLNQMLVPESAGGNLKWVKLSDNSKMLINDEVSIEFRRTKK